MKLFVVLAMLLACSPPLVNGSGVLLDVQPAAPSFSGSYDFDLLEPVVGRGCVARYRPEKVYWVQLPGLTHPPSDATTRYAIGAAAFAALASVPSADTVLVTRAVSREERGRVCATVHGRAVRIRKAAMVASVDLQKPSSEDDRATIPSLDRPLISQTIKDALPFILQCATFDRGDVHVSVTVAPSGLVINATVIRSPSKELGACVVAEVKKLVFPPSRSGATFVHPFTL